MQFTIGWLRLIPGRREAFIPEARAHQVACRRERGCLFFEWHPSSTDPDMMLLIEGWETPAHHKAHLTAPHHLALVEKAGDYAVWGRFEEIEAKNVVTHGLEFLEQDEDPE